MHIEPGVVDGAKIVLSYATAAGAVSLAAKMAWDTVKNDGVVSFALRSLLSTIAVFVFFEVFFKYPIGNDRFLSV